MFCIENFAHVGGLDILNLKQEAEVLYYQNIPNTIRFNSTQ